MYLLHMFFELLGFCGRQMLFFFMFFFEVTEWEPWS